MGAEVAVTVLHRKESQIREAFHRAGALDPTKSQPLTEIGVEESMALRSLQRHDIVRESSPDCYYFDDDVWKAVSATRLRMVLMIVAAATLTALVGLYAAWANR